MTLPYTLHTVYGRTPCAVALTACVWDVQCTLIYINCALSFGNYSACGTFDLHGFCGTNICCVFNIKLQNMYMYVYMCMYVYMYMNIDTMCMHVHVHSPIIHCLGLNSILRILTSILHSSATRDPVAQW